MADYTPTTEEIRADYCLLADVSRPRQLQFDRWLAEHDRLVIWNYLREKLHITPEEK